MLSESTFMTGSADCFTLGIMGQIIRNLLLQFIFGGESYHLFVWNEELVNPVSMLCEEETAGRWDLEVSALYLHSGFTC